MKFDKKSAKNRQPSWNSTKNRQKIGNPPEIRQKIGSPPEIRQNRQLSEIRRCVLQIWHWNFELFNLTNPLFVSRAEKISELSTSFPTTRAWQQETAVKWSFLATPGEPLRIRQPSSAIRQRRTGRVQESTIYGVWDRYALRIGDCQWSFCFRLAPERSAAASSRCRLNKWIRLASTQAHQWKWL